MASKHIFENLEKTWSVTQQKELFSISPSDFPGGSEQAYRGSARTRAPRVSQNWNGSDRLVNTKQK